MPETMNAIQAVVVKVIPNGRHGPYAVAMPLEDSHQQQLGKSITFSIGSGQAWQEENHPTVSLHVNLFDVQKHTAGWRANSVQPIRA